MIYLREATTEDRELLYEWANDPETRRASFHTEIIAYEEHCRWFERILNDKNELQFILMNQDEPVGQVRLTLEGEDAVVSYSIAPDKRGLGYGKEIIRLICEEARRYPFVRKIVARIKPLNKASMACFEKAGFIEEYRQVALEVFVGGYRLTRKNSRAYVCREVAA